MALETVVNYSQDPFSYYGFKDLYSMIGGSNNVLAYNEDPEFGFEQFIEPSTMDVHSNNNTNWEDFYATTTTTTTTATTTPSSGHDHSVQIGNDRNTPESSSLGQRKRRRRARSGKNKEELETQRMTHIAVERNRRRQMNDYLAALRSLMPPSYVPRSDQASIIGGAINFVKELEQKLQCMESEKGGHGLAEFFAFPQYSVTSDGGEAESSESRSQQWAVADIEVTVVDSHANLKIMAKRRPRQLLNIAAGLQALCLGILHLNVTTVDQMVLYSVSVKIEEGCQLNTVDEIASAVNEMLRRIQREEPAFT